MALTSSRSLNLATDDWRSASACSDTSQIFLQMPQVPDTTDTLEAEGFVRSLQVLTAGLPPIALASAAQPVAFISTEL